MATQWTDPTGAAHPYTTTPGRWDTARRSLERDRTWRGIDPSFDSQGLSVTEDGRLIDDTGPNPWLMGALTLAAPFAAGGALGAFGGVGGAAAAGGGGSSGLGGIYGLPGAIASQGASAGIGAAGGGMGGLLGSLGGVKGLIGLGGKAAGLFSQGQAQNRDAQFSGQLDLEQLLMQREALQQRQRIDREQEGRAGSTDAWRKLLAGQYAQNRGPAPQLSPYSVAPRDLSGLKAGADPLMQEALKRLQGGNPIPQVVDRAPMVDPSLLKAGGVEKTLGGLAPFLAGIGGGPNQGGGELAQLRALLGGR